MEVFSYIVNNKSPVSAQCYTESSVYKDSDGVERVAYSGYLYANSSIDLTVSEYMELRKRSEPELELICIGHDELEKRHQNYVEHAKKSEHEVTQKDWWWKLECLPPCRWCTVEGVELFHVSERICFNLVSWLGRIDDRYFEIVDDAATPLNDIAKRFKALCETLSAVKSNT